MNLPDPSETPTLAFTPSGPHFKLAPVVWQGLQLGTWKTWTPTPLDLSDLSLDHCLIEVFGSLNLIEIFRLFLLFPVRMLL